MFRRNKRIISKIKSFLICVKECGISFTFKRVSIFFGMSDPQPIHTSKYRAWEQNDKIKKIMDQVINFDVLITSNKLIKPPSKEITLKLNNGINIYLRPQKYFAADLHTIYETILRQDYGLVNEGDLVIDIGAYIGDFTIFAANLGAIVYAFEPSPDSYCQLLRNVQLMKFTSISTYNKAVCSSKDVGKNFSLICDSHNMGANKISPSTSSSQIKCISLKQIFDENNLKKCNLLKMDCEGSEYSILEDLDEKTYSKIEKIVLEFHNGCPKKLEKLRRKLESEHFFVKTVISPYSRIEGLLYCWKLD